MLDLVLHPHNVLSRVSKPLTLGEIKTDKFRRLVSEMYAAMYRHRGVGLAAPQVGFNVRLLVLNPTGRRDYHETGGICLINPSIIPLSDPIKMDEGCLSIPNIYAPVWRPDLISVKTLDTMGREHKFQVSGFVSRIIQHEIDHLDGLTFLDRLTEEARESIKLQLDDHLRRMEEMRAVEEEERRKKEAKEKKRKKDKERLKRRGGACGDW